MAWYVYIVRCNDGSLYTGVTTDLTKRVARHNAGRAGAKYTRPRRPVRLVFTEPAATRSAAMKRECQIKKLSATAKQRLLAGAKAENMATGSRQIPTL